MRQTLRARMSVSSFHCCGRRDVRSIDAGDKGGEESGRSRGSQQDPEEHVDGIAFDSSKVEQYLRHKVDLVRSPIISEGSEGQTGKKFYRQVDVQTVDERPEPSVDRITLARAWACEAMNKVAVKSRNGMRERVANHAQSNVSSTEKGG